MSEVVLCLLWPCLAMWRSPVTLSVAVQSTKMLRSALNFSKATAASFELTWEGKDDNCLKGRKKAMYN